MGQKMNRPTSGWELGLPMPSFKSNSVALTQNEPLSFPTKEASPCLIQGTSLLHRCLGPP